MTSATKKPGGWSTVRQHLTTWEKPELLALVKDLYGESGDTILVLIDKAVLLYKQNTFNQSPLPDHK